METFSKFNFYIIIFLQGVGSFEREERYRGCKTSLELLYGL